MGGSSVEQVARLKYELSVALQRRIVSLGAGTVAEASEFRFPVPVQEISPGEATRPREREGGGEDYSGMARFANMLTDSANVATRTVSTVSGALWVDVNPEPVSLIPIGYLRLRVEEG